MQHLDPLPDLFSLAAACRRTAALARSCQAHLHVGQRPRGEPDNYISGRWFASLAEAVRCSRPGDIISIQAGHHIVEDPVVVAHPLRIQGQKEGAARPVLEASRGRPVLVTQSTCVLEDVEIRALLAPCVVHRRGSLTARRCVFRTQAHALAHLWRPIASKAHAADAPARCYAPAYRPAAGSVGVSLEECWLGGGSQGVDHAPGGCLKNVRVAMDVGGAWLWLRVVPAPGPAHGTRVAPPCAAASTSMTTARADVVCGRCVALEAECAGGPDAGADTRAGGTGGASNAPDAMCCRCGRPAAGGAGPAESVGLGEGSGAPWIAVGGAGAAEGEPRGGVGASAAGRGRLRGGGSQRTRRPWWTTFSRCVWRTSGRGSAWRRADATLAAPGHRHCVTTRTRARRRRG
ncbi:unnamed protein product [Pedinophyceae sp. YPF-701]|nr:unnamed protein product [Pedinophyceae sp. YPF-701]